jgi:ribosome-associated protein
MPRRRQHERSKTLSPTLNVAARKRTAPVPRGRPSPDETLALIQTRLDDSKAADIVRIDLQGKSSLADYMVVASGGSNRHVASIADHLVEALQKAGVHDTRVEGTPHCDWVLIDAGDVIVHVFRPEVREFYNLEKMWARSKRAG